VNNKRATSCSSGDAGENVSGGTSPNVKIPSMWAPPGRRKGQSKEHHLRGSEQKRE